MDQLGRLVKTSDEFWADIDKAPRSWDLRLIFADWLEENSNDRLDRALALGMRWMAKHKKCYPFRPVRPRSWEYDRTSRYGLWLDTPGKFDRLYTGKVYSLPDEIWDLYQEAYFDDLVKQYPARRIDELRLGVAIMELEESKSKKRSGRGKKPQGAPVGNEVEVGA